MSDEERIEEEEVVEAQVEAASDDAPEEEALAEDAATEAPDEPDWEDLAKRKAAEFENFRKQSAQRIQKASRDGMKRVASEILPALDDFERALAHAEAEEGDEQHTLTKGIRLVQEQLLAALKRAGIEAFSPKGEAFDPHLHEAVATTPIEGAEAGTVVEVYQAGYRLGDDVLRAAKVVVAA
ncbi:MAG: nucleotide exchange factor GrpE [Solirubrobacteraceae bacterium]